MRRKVLFVVIPVILCVLGVLFVVVPKVNYNTQMEPGQITDSLDGVYTYFNGGVGQTHGRNTADGYNVGLKYQCVEFVKRYYLLHYGHKMPDSYGHAKDFFDPAIPDGKLNKQRALTQYTNGSLLRPEKGDLLIFAPTLSNKYGHVAIISKVSDNEVEIIQQNPGPKGSSRKILSLRNEDGRWSLPERVLGWLRMTENAF